MRRTNPPEVEVPVQIQLDELEDELRRTHRLLAQLLRMDSESLSASTMAQRLVDHPPLLADWP